MYSEYYSENFRFCMPEPLKQENHTGVLTVGPALKWYKDIA